MMGRGWDDGITDQTVINTVINTVDLTCSGSAGSSCAASSGTPVMSSWMTSASAGRR